MRYYGYGPFGGTCDWSLFFTSPGGIAMMIIFTVVIGLLIYLAVTRSRGGDGGQRPYFGTDRLEDPVYIAKKRFAEGEITSEELDTILDRLKRR